MGVGLYTSRVVLQTLGVSDYGIYNVVGSSVAMFSLVSGSLSFSILRYLTFELGAGNKARLTKIFSASLNIFCFIAFVIVIIAESFGVWFINNHLEVPAERLNTTMWVFQISLITFLVNIISLPYNALIQAHEKFNVYAYISIVEVVLKLILVFVLMYITFDKLISYTVMLLIIAIIVRIINGIYCLKHFEESKYSFFFEKGLYKELLSFSGWNFIGNTGYVLKNQGVNIVLNLFFGVTVNAARGIALQVSTIATSFVNSFTTAITPQITKSYAQTDYKITTNLVYTGTLWACYLVLLLSLPVLLETEFILKLWLTIVPEYTIIFVQLIMVSVIVDLLSKNLTTLIMATGNVRFYQCLNGSLLILIIPISILLLKWGFQPYITLIVSIIISFISLIIRILILRKRELISIKFFILKVLSKIFLIVICSLAFPILLKIKLEDSFASAILIMLITSASTLLSIYYIGVTQKEKQWIHSKMKRK
jgi:O-antigen/teichoic acid export membrane protein